jgi:hypothetical protein
MSRIPVGSRAVTPTPFYQLFVVPRINRTSGDDSAITE